MGAVFSKSVAERYGDLGRDSSRSSSLFTVISPRFALALLVLVASVHLAHLFGVRIEDAQSALFPLFLLCFLGFFAAPAFRFPLWLGFAAVCCWFLALLHINQVFTVGGSPHQALMARLAGDDSSLEGRDLFSRVNQIADTYVLTRAKLIFRSVDSEKEAQGLLASNPESPYLVWGDSEWYRIASQGNLANLGLGAAIASTTVDNKEQQLPLQHFGLSRGHYVSVVSQADFGPELAIVVVPEYFNMPARPEELARHFLAWLSEGLAADSLLRTKVDPAISTTSMRLDAFNEASLIDGVWKSHAPLGFADQMLGTFTLLDSLKEDRERGREGERAAAFFRKAAGYARHETDPELYAAIFNNAAVTMALRGSSPEDFQKAETWLHHALGAVKKGASVPQGSRAALFNLNSLFQTGLLPPTSKQR